MQFEPPWRKPPIKSVIYPIVVIGHNKGEDDLGLAFTDTLRDVMPFHSLSMRAYKATTKVPSATEQEVKFCLQPVGQGFDAPAVRDSEGFVIVYNANCEASFREMSSDVWSIRSIKSQQRVDGKITANPTQICVIGYSGPSPWGLTALPRFSDRLTYSPRRSEERGPSTDNDPVEPELVERLVADTGALHVSLGDWSHASIASIAADFAKRIRVANGLAMVPRTNRSWYKVKMRARRFSHKGSTAIKAAKGKWDQFMA